MADSAPSPTLRRYAVSGMDCASCVSKVETALGRLPGVGEAKVNFASETLSLRLDSAKTGEREVLAALDRLGYGARPLDPRPPAEAAAEKADHTDHDHDHGAGAPLDRAWWRTPRAQLTVLLALALAAAFIAVQLAPATERWVYLVPTLIGVWHFGRRALAFARADSPFSIEMLMTVAAVGAVVIDATAEAAVVVFLFAVGELLEGVAAGRARAGIRALAALVPARAQRETAAGTEEIAADRLAIGDVIVVRPGERVPADGRIVSGDGALDESPVTGESVPVAKGPGASVYAGSVAHGATLRVEVTAEAADNTIARVIKLVEQAQEAKAPTERFIQRFSRWYTPGAVAIALLVALAPPLLFAAPWDVWIYRALTVLLIACPCALVISVPAAIASGLAAGARRGLLIKGGGALETIGQVRIIAFDKTGTLTAGRPRVVDVALGAGMERAELLRLAASVEAQSSHPLAAAIVEAARKEGIAPSPATATGAIPGKAAYGVVDGRRIEAASRRRAEEGRTLPPDLMAKADEFEADGMSLVVLVADDRPLGVIGLRDELRPDAAAGVAELKRLGLATTMLSGDTPRAAGAIARRLQMDAQGGLMPEDKLQVIADLRARRGVIMVGDGINDAPALAAASVGVAMGGGTAAALEAGDAAILNDRVRGLADLVSLSRATRANILQNVTVSLGLKAVFLATSLTGITGLWIAILADTGATVLVTLNALRLLCFRPPGRR